MSEAWQAELTKGGPPAQEGRTPSEPPAHGLHEDQIAPFDPPVADRDRQGKRHGRRGGIAVLGDGRNHLPGRYVQFARSAVENALVGLVRYEPVDVGDS